MPPSMNSVSCCRLYHRTRNCRRSKFFGWQSATSRSSTMSQNSAANRDYLRRNYPSHCPTVNRNYLFYGLWSKKGVPLKVHNLVYRDYCHYRSYTDFGVNEVFFFIHNTLFNFNRCLLEVDRIDETIMIRTY